jgi:hypothetical protein
LTATLDKVDIPDRDRAIRDLWATGSPKPLVFLMGLHRSGTTVLYQYLSRVLPLASVTVQDVVFYPRLVYSHTQDGGRADRALLVDYFEAHGMSQRALDDIALGPETVEEYGWILKREAGSFALGEPTVDAFRELRLKLSYLRADAEALLLKNPWDTAHAHEIASTFPEARFVFLRRDPIEILSSEVRNAMSFSTEKNALVQILTRRMPQVRLYLGLARVGHRLLGDERSERLLVRWFLKDIMNKLAAYRAAMERVPAERSVHVSYRELVDDTPRTLERLSSFLGLTMSAVAGDLQARRRPGGLLASLASSTEVLSEELRRGGCGWAMDA